MSRKRAGLAPGPASEKAIRAEVLLRRELAGLITDRERIELDRLVPIRESEGMTPLESYDQSWGAGRER